MHFELYTVFLWKTFGMEVFIQDFGMGLFDQDLGMGVFNVHSRQVESTVRNPTPKNYFPSIALKTCTQITERNFT